MTAFSETWQESLLSESASFLAGRPEARGGSSGPAGQRGRASLEAARTAAASEAAAPRFLFRAAGIQHLAYIRAWLPDSLPGTPKAKFIVATDADTGKVAGIAALRVCVDRVGRFLLFVDPAFRRRGCGTALMTRALQTARAANAIHALTGRSFEAAADDEGTLGALAFLRGRGLSVAQEIVRCRAELKTALAVLEPLFQRYERGAGQPHRARIVTADRVDPRVLAAFAVRDVGGFPDEIAARLAGRGRAYCRATSMVALVDDAIVGAHLTVTRGNNAFIETCAVEIAHRRRGVNLALMYHAAAAADRLGIRTIGFEHDVREPDTAKLARRFSATPVGRRQCWGCSLPEGPRGKLSSSVVAE